LRPSKILIVSRSRSTAEALEQHLSERREFQPAIRVIANGHADPLQGIDSLPDILLLHSTSGQIELQFLAENGVNGNLPLICCGPADDTEAMRLAMRAGAKDYLPEPIASGDLIACIERIRSETLRANGPAKGKLIAITNGKGGSGASFLSTSLAHSLAIEEDQNVVLADMDLQFGGLFRYLDLNPKMGIVEALDAVTEIDDISADAYTCEHPSGLRLLSAANTGARLPRAISIERLESLLDVYLSMYD
jgi:pilus assembly protein CpaE